MPIWAVSKIDVNCAGYGLFPKLTSVMQVMVILDIININTSDGYARGRKGIFIQPIFPLILAADSKSTHFQLRKQYKKEANEANEAKDGEIFLL